LRADYFPDASRESAEEATRFMAMVLGVGIGLAPPLLLFNFAFYLTGACLAAWGLNRNIDSQNKLGQNDIGRSDEAG